VSRSITARGFWVVAALSSHTSRLPPWTRSSRIGKSRRTTWGSKIAPVLVGPGWLGVSAADGTPAGSGGSQYRASIFGAPLPLVAGSTRSAPDAITGTSTDGNSNGSANAGTGGAEIPAIAAGGVGAPGGDSAALGPGSGGNAADARSIAGSPTTSPIIPSGMRSSPPGTCSASMGLDGVGDGGALLVGSPAGAAGESCGELPGDTPGGPASLAAWSGVSRGTSEAPAGGSPANRPSEIASAPGSSAGSVGATPAPVGAAPASPGELAAMLGTPGSPRASTSERPSARSSCGGR